MESNSSCEDLDELLEEFEKVDEKKPHFLDYDGVTTPPLEFEENPTGTKKKKHFLDENPIPPPNMMMERRERKNSCELNRSCVSSGRLVDSGQSNNARNTATWPSDKPIETVNVTISDDHSITLGPKVECVYSLLSMVGSNDRTEMANKFYELSKTPEKCANLRRSGCIPLLVPIIYSDADESARRKASKALHNVVNCQPSDKTGRREAKVLRLIENINDYCDRMKILKGDMEGATAAEVDGHPLEELQSLMKMSYDEEHRYAMCQLGALQTIAQLVYVDHLVHGMKSGNSKCTSLRRYAGMALTNLTFGDGNNKALLCTNKDFMKALVAQLNSEADDLLQVTASVIRNLAWRADNVIKATLQEIGTVTALTDAAMRNKNENTLKAILSALWNLSAHSRINKVEICSVDNALDFLVSMLVFDSPSKKLTIIENAGGILRNISSHIAVREDYRLILRKRDCLGILLQQLKSESLTIVSNACGTLWNLSARCAEDQKYLWDNGAIPMLRSLIHSKHKMISNGSSAALKNLLNYKPPDGGFMSMDSVGKAMGLRELPSLNVRKQRALEQELEERGLAETYDNMDASTPQRDDTSEDSRSEQINMRMITSRAKTIEGIKTIAFSTDTVKTIPDSDTKISKIPPNLKGETITKYQEIDSDQITNYSLLYAENDPKSDSTAKRFGHLTYQTEVLPTTEEDSVKCYETEGTPYVISNAASITDLRLAKPEAIIEEHKKLRPRPMRTISGSGLQTPERPVKYCEEGTPGMFSRADSLSSLDELPNAEFNPREQTKNPDIREKISLTPPLNDKQLDDQVLDDGAAAKHVQISAQQTPLMFSRHSSLESLASMEPIMEDEQSSVVSDFSRLQSGVISPSEVPDSPTQLMPGNSKRITHSGTQSNTSYLVDNSIPSASHNFRPTAAPRLRSVFEDDVNRFDIENTPAQFSCATSLSNLSLDDEPKITTDSLTKEMKLMTLSSEESPVLPGPDFSVLNENDVQSDKPSVSGIVAQRPESSDSDSNISGANDDEILANCISLGMNRPKEEKARDSIKIIETVQSYRTEDTPANALSKAGSNSNLSALSFNTNQYNREDISSDESSNGSDAASDLFNKCIADGIAKATASPVQRVQSHDLAGSASKNISEGNTNPILMMRKGGINDYIASSENDNVQRFTVEDTPCNYSTITGLSGLTVGSAICGVIDPRTVQRDFGQPPVGADGAQGGNDSLSSLSADSEDDANVLNQAISAGLEAKTKSKPQTATGVVPKVPIIPPKPKPEDNESTSSIDSCDLDSRQADALLEQAIRTGMMARKAGGDGSINPVPPKVPPRAISNPQPQVPPLPANMKTSVQATHPRRSMLPTPKTPSQVERERQRIRERKDELLFEECINVGMGKEPNPNILKQVNERARQELSRSTRRPDRQPNPNDLERRLASMNISGYPNESPPKNGNTTPAAAPGNHAVHSTVTGVQKVHQAEDIKESENDQHVPLITSMTKSGYDINSKEDQFLSFSFNDSALDCSNECKATPLNCSNNDEYFIVEDTALCFDMDASNEFMIENIVDNLVSSHTSDKHKDPDLMLRSVERLTQEFVATAEYLRKLDTSSNEFDEKIVSTDKPKKSSEPNTWNDDSAMNNISFPSISIAKPMIKSLTENDDDATTKSDFSKELLLDEPTPTNERRHDDILISFEVGGELKSRDYSSIPYSTNSNSTMSNSTIIAAEATMLAQKLMQMSDSTTSLNIDQIGPPSTIEYVSLSHIPDDTPTASPKHLGVNRTPKKMLMQGLMAKRAIANGHISRSVESVNSISYNLDNIQPPSLMNELLDSMISVDSITSEIIDHSGGGVSHHATNSVYRTACSEMEDTLTLQSCLDLPDDANDTPIPSDMSSAECTPVKKLHTLKRTLTPRQKRQSIKERYRTYTIAADMLIKSSGNDIDATWNDSDDIELDPAPINVVDQGSPTRSNLTPRQRRQENRSRFETQVLNKSVLAGLNNGLKDQLMDESLTLLSNTDDSELSSIQAMTSRFKYIQKDMISTHQMDVNVIKHFNILRSKSELPHTESEFESIDYEQTSETESCGQHHCSDSNEESTPRKMPIVIKRSATVVEESVKDAEQSKAIRGRKKPPYVSPYRRNIVSPGQTTSIKSVTTTKEKINGFLNKPAISKLLTRNEQIVTKTHVIPNKSNLNTKPNGREKSPLKKESPKTTTKQTKSTLLSKITTPFNRKATEVKNKTTTKATSDPKASPSLERQGTFVKEEASSLKSLPVVDSKPTSPARSKGISKLRVPIQKSASSGAKPIAPQSPSKGKEGVVGHKTTATYRKSLSDIQRSTSNLSMKRKDVKSSDGKTQSNSNLSQPKRDSVPLTKTSRISSIWKKQGITAETKKSSIPTFSTKPTLIRSSTFDKPSKTST